MQELNKIEIKDYKNQLNNLNVCKKDSTTSQRNNLIFTNRKSNDWCYYW